MSTAPRPILLLQSPDPAHPFDAYLDEALLTVGHKGYVKRAAQDLGDLAEFALALVSSGTAAGLIRNGCWTSSGRAGAPASPSRRARVRVRLTRDRERADYRSRSERQ
jgi:hypothetical protein